MFKFNNNIKWDYLSLNPNAIWIIEQNLDKVDWYFLSENPNAIHHIAHWYVGF